MALLSAPLCLLSILLTPASELEPLRQAILTRRQDRTVWTQTVQAVEAQVQSAGASAFQFDAQGFASLKFQQNTWQAGYFSMPSLAQLKARLSQPSPAAPLRFSVLRGADPLTDIGALQAYSTSGTLFQVASQFNGLEAPGPRLVPVADYFTDPTQGPRAAISAFPGLLLRHYAAPRPGSVQTRFVQSASQQLNFLADAVPAQLAQVQQGYLQARQVSDPAALATALEQNFENLRVGLHQELEVVLGYDWTGQTRPGQRIHQVLTSTLAAGAYSPELDPADPNWQRIMRQLLRGAYLGTLLSAAELQSPYVVLTPIGGGVFANPHPLIWEAICWALDEAQAYVSSPMHVVLNGRDFGSGLTEALLNTEVHRRGGVLRHLP